MKSCHHTVLIKKNNNDIYSSTNYQTQTHNHCTRRMTMIIYNLILFLVKSPNMWLAGTAIVVRASLLVNRYHHPLITNNRTSFTTSFVLSLLTTSK